MSIQKVRYETKCVKYVKITLSKNIILKIPRHMDFMEVARLIVVEGQKLALYFECDLVNVVIIAPKGEGDWFIYL